MIMLIVNLAVAHVPHDTVLALAVPGGLDPAQPWMLVANPEGATLLLSSSDAGKTWEMVGGEPLADKLIDAASLRDGTILLLADDRYWWSSDGKSWDQAPVPGAVYEVAPGASGTVVLAGAGGIWVGRPGGPFTLEYDEQPVVRLGDGPVAIASDGSVLRAEEGSWVSVGHPGVPAASAAASPAAVWVGGTDGSVWESSGGVWTACAPLPNGGDPAHGDIVEVTVAGDAVYVLPGWGGPFRAEAGCQAWEDRSTPEAPSYGGFGDATTSRQGWTGLAVGGDELLVSGWEGIYNSADAGHTWAHSPTIPTNHTRGLGWTSAGGVLVGGYAAGVIRTDATAQAFDAPNHGLTASNVQRVLAVPGNSEAVWAIIGHFLWRSDDGALTWAPPDVDVGRVQDLDVWAPNRVWIIADGVVAETVDEGDSWSPIEGLDEALAGAQPIGSGLADNGEACFSALNPDSVVCRDRTGDWGASHTLGDDTLTSPVPWPRDTPERWFVGGSEGVYRSEDGGGTWAAQALEEGDEATLLGDADDGTLFAVTRSGLIFRSLDGGDSWELAATTRLPARAYVLAARPGFADHPDLLIGTHDGPFLLSGANGATPQLRRFTGYERVDDHSGFVSCQGCPEPSSDSTAAFDSVQALPLGAELEFWIRGDRIRIVGTSDAGGVADVVVDQAPGETERSVAGGTLFEVDGLGDGWHRVRIAGRAGSVAFDYAEAWSVADTTVTVDPGDTAEDPAPNPEPPCGCGSTAAAALLPFGALYARRRRYSGGTPP